jgi:glycosyltransferase involved in cell wall biosynthesis
MDKRSVKRKNIKNLLKALSLIIDKNVKLNIIGDGDYQKTLRKWVTQYNLNNRVNFLGKIPNSEIDRYYQSATAFLLPSNSETFGLVYAESLLNGTPILYSKNRLGFDGFFEDVGPAVNPASIDSIKTGITDCILKSKIYRGNIEKLSLNGAFQIFSKSYIKNVYERSIL